jgi:hypothetical protein
MKSGSTSLNSVAKCRIGRAMLSPCADGRGEIQAREGDGRHVVPPTGRHRRPTLGCF